MKESLRQGKVVTLPQVNTIADGTAVKRPGEKLFPYIQENVDEIITIDDNELIVAFLDMVENHKMIVENSGLLTVAALKHIKAEKKKVVSILSGGNMDVITLSSIVQHGLIQRDRVFTVSVLLPDKPGELARVSSLWQSSMAILSSWSTTSLSASTAMRLWNFGLPWRHLGQSIKSDRNGFDRCRIPPQACEGKGYLQRDVGHVGVY